MYFLQHGNAFSDFEEKSGRRRIFMADHGCHPSRAPWWAQPWQWGPLGRTLAPPPFFEEHLYDGDDNHWMETHNKHGEIY